MRFIVVSHKKVFLVCSVPVCACHISRYCNCASFFNTIKAEIESIFKPPANCRYNPNTFIYQVCTYPSVAKGVCSFQFVLRFWFERCLSKVSFINALNRTQMTLEFWNKPSLKISQRLSRYFKAKKKCLNTAIKSSIRA